MASRKVRSYLTEEVDLFLDFLSLSYAEGKEIVLSAYREAFPKAKRIDDAILQKWSDLKKKQDKQQEKIDLITKAGLHTPKKSAQTKTGI